jgi:hypothetical protein
LAAAHWSTRIRPPLVRPVGLMHVELPSRSDPGGGRAAPAPPGLLGRESTSQPRPASARGDARAAGRQNWPRTLTGC